MSSALVYRFFHRLFMCTLSLLVHDTRTIFVNISVVFLNFCYSNELHLSIFLTFVLCISTPVKSFDVLIGNAPNLVLLLSKID